MIPIEAFKAKEGIAFLAGAAVSFLVAALLLANGIDRYLHESTLRDAVQAYHRDEGTARALLLELKDARPNDAGVRVLLGAYEIDRAESDPDRIAIAERLFEEARGIDGRPSATVGLAVCALHAAAGKAKEGRAQAAALVQGLVDGLDKSSSDVVGLQAAIELLRGRPEQALQLTERPPESISREGLAAWHWNRAIAGMLARKGAALESGLVAYMLRRTPAPSESDPNATPTDVTKLLNMAYRSGLDAPGKPDEVLRRAELARRALGSRFSGSGTLRGRFAPPGPAEGVVLNALGMALYRLKRFEEAAQAFDDALRTPGSSLEPLYLLNLAEARFQQAMATDEKEAQARKNLFNSSAQTFRRICEAVKSQEGREATRVLAATNAAVAYLQANDRQQALNVYRQFSDGHPNAAQQARDAGALYDWCNQINAIEQYRKAVSLNHPEQGQLERRIRTLTQRMEERRR